MGFTIYSNSFFNKLVFKNRRGVTKIDFLQKGVH